MGSGAARVSILKMLSVIGVKAAAAHRQAYDPIASASYTVDTPGPCTENLKRLLYRRVKRPIYPLDAILRTEKMPENSPLQYRIYFC